MDEENQKLRAALTDLARERNELLERVELLERSIRDQPPPPKRRREEQPQSIADLLAVTNVLPRFQTAIDEALSPARDLEFKLAQLDLERRRLELEARKTDNLVGLGLAVFPAVLFALTRRAEDRDEADRARSAYEKFRETQVSAEEVLEGEDS